MAAWRARNGCNWLYPNCGGCSCTVTLAAYVLVVLPTNQAIVSIGGVDFFIMYTHDSDLILLCERVISLSLDCLVADGHVFRLLDKTQLQGHLMTYRKIKIGRVGGKHVKNLKSQTTKSS